MTDKPTEAAMRAAEAVRDHLYEYEHDPEGLGVCDDVLAAIIDRETRLKEKEAALRAWMLVESEMADNHPCPDLALRARYRKTAVDLTRAALKGT